MKTRPKPPSLVSMWMLDVFCCALGCVTLLWLLNTREAGEQAKRAGSALELLAQTEADLSRTKAQLMATLTDLDQTRLRLNGELAAISGKLAAMTTERDDTAKRLATTDAELTETRTKLAATAIRSKELDELLARKTKDAADLNVKLTLSTQSAEELARLLRTKEMERADLALKAKKAEDQLNDVDARLKAITKEAQEATSNLAAMRKTGDELTSARGTIKDIQKKLDDASATIIDLQGQKAKLADKYDKLRVESDNRFAGITLTGTRVVFAIDVSGSMKMQDSKVEAPKKWPEVVETVGKVMRSLQGLEKFQIVTFSRQAKYLLTDGGWVDYHGEASVKQVTDALKAVDPVGGTNLYDGLDLAFRLRSDGLDAVYLFSDGLPTEGRGLTPEQETSLPLGDRTQVLSRHIRGTLNGEWNKPQNGQRVKIHAIGFFFESPDLGAFLWALSRENDGSFVGMSRP